MLEENWNTVQVFLRCKQDWVVGAASAHANGFTALEIQAACHLAQIPPDTWPDVSDQVAAMGRIAAEDLNSRKKP